jgi:hypothetical protein
MLFEGSDFRFFFDLDFRFRFAPNFWTASIGDVTGPWCGAAKNHRLSLPLYRVWSLEELV